MWFKSAMIYRLNRDLKLDANEVANQLQAFTFTSMSGADMAKTGWVPPMGRHSEQLVNVAGDHLLLRLHREEKILPANVIKAATAARIEKIEDEQQRKLKKTEKYSIKDEVLHGLMTRLPAELKRATATHIWIDRASNLIIVDAASAKKAEDSLAMLRKSLGSLPVVPLTLQSPIEFTMTEWVRSGDMPAGFALGDSATLKAILEGGSAIKAKNQDLVCDEISTHLDAGKMVTELAMDWQERIQFRISDDGSLKGIKFCDTLQEQNDDIDRDDFAQRFDADFHLMTGEMSALISNLIDVLGGEAKMS